MRKNIWLPDLIVKSPNSKTNGIFLLLPGKNIKFKMILIILQKKKNLYLFNINKFKIIPKNSLYKLIIF